MTSPSQWYTCASKAQRAWCPQSAAAAELVKYSWLPLPQDPREQQKLLSPQSSRIA